LRGGGHSSAIGRSAALLRSSSAAIALVIALAGCGSSAKATPQALQLERADLVAVCRALNAAKPAAVSEVAATKAAWPLIANGLPADTSTVSRPAILLAIKRARSLHVPGLFQEHQAVVLTGAGSSLAGIFRTYGLLANRGWQLIGGAIQEIEHGSPAAARFARANVALYIESVYDAHFSLAQIGKKLLTDYKNQGGPAAFGTSLTQAEIDSLADTYSEAQDRLYPHTGVRLGS
jgi:hypothetical protein